MKSENSKTTAVAFCVLAWWSLIFSTFTYIIFWKGHSPHWYWFMLLIGDVTFFRDIVGKGKDETS